MAHPSVPLLCPKGTVLCVATGPSLTAEDVAYARERVDAAIVVNDAHLLCPDATCLYAADAKWWHEYAGVPTFTGLKYSLQSDAGRWPGVQVLQRTGEDGLETQPTGLRTGRNSGYQAIGLAVHFGATRIVLLGYDMGHTSGQASHFFGEHPRRLRASYLYPTFIPHFETLVEPLRQLGVSVINCTRQTALTVFPHMSLEEVLA